MSKESALFWLEFGEWALFVASIFVVIGIVGEIKKNHSLEMMARLHIFEILVLIGVTGELVADGIVFFTSSRLQVIQSEESRCQQEKLTSAETTLALTIKRTRELEAAAKQADLKIAFLSTQAKLEEVKVKDAEIRVASANLKVEEMHKKNLTMEAALVPRVINQELFSEKLKNFSGMSAIIRSVDDIESRRLAGQIRFSLDHYNIRGAQWVLIDDLRTNTNFQFSDGVSVYANVGPIPKGDRSREAAEALIAALKENHIEARRMPAGDLPPNTLEIQIGFKPQKIGSSPGTIEY